MRKLFLCFALLASPALGGDYILDQQYRVGNHLGSPVLRKQVVKNRISLAEKDEVVCRVMSNRKPALSVLWGYSNENRPPEQAKHLFGNVGSGRVYHQTANDIYIVTNDVDDYKEVFVDFVKGDSKSRIIHTYPLLVKPNYTIIKISRKYLQGYSIED